jgi:Flp pilus assembly protein protease CpaA
MSDTIQVLHSAIVANIAIVVLLYAIKIQERWRARGIDFIFRVREITILHFLSIGFSLLIIGKQVPITSSLAISGIIGLAILASHVDWRTCKIPNELVLLGCILGIVGIIFDYSTDKLLTLGVTVLFLLIATTITNFLTKGQLGAGDIKLLIPLSLLTYWGSPMAIFYGILGSFFLQLILRKVWNKNKENPKAKSAPYGYALTTGILAALSIL